MVGKGPVDLAPPGLTNPQIACIRSHLALVFKHEIDPSAGDAVKQKVLNEIHSGSAVDLNLVPRC